MQLYKLLIELIVELFVSISIGMLSFIIPVHIFYHFYHKNDKSKDSIKTDIYDKPIKDPPNIEIDETDVEIIDQVYPVYIGPLPYVDGIKIKEYDDSQIKTKELPPIKPHKTIEYTPNMKTTNQIYPVYIGPLPYIDGIKIKMPDDLIIRTKDLHSIGPHEYDESIEILKPKK